MTQISNTAVQIRVTGTKELGELLRRASRSITVKEMQGMIIKSAKPMVEMAKTDALMANPRRKTYKGSRSGSDFTLKPGVISRSINTKVLKNPDTAVVIVAPLFKKNRNIDPWFSHFVHEGTAERSYRGQSRGQIKANNRVQFMNRAGSNAMRNMVVNSLSKQLVMKLNELGL